MAETSIKNHPAFLAFSKSSVKATNKQDTELANAEKDKTEVKNDQKYTGNNGGEGSKG